MIQVQILLKFLKSNGWWQCKIKAEIRVNGLMWDVIPLIPAFFRHEDMTVSFGKGLYQFILRCINIKTFSCQMQSKTIDTEMVSLLWALGRATDLNKLPLKIKNHSSIILCPYWQWFQKGRKFVKVDFTLSITSSINNIDALSSFLERMLCNTNTSIKRVPSFRHIKIR